MSCNKLLGGRPKNANFERLSFILTKESGKYEAYCEICKKSLKNTAASRLKAHRNVCKLKNTTDETTYSNFTNTMDSNSDIEIEYIDFNDETATNSQTILAPIGLITPTTSDSPSSSITSETRWTSVPTSRIATTSKKITNFIDTVSTKEREEFTDALANFFFGCNISLSIVESEHFKKMIKKLRPAYASFIPSRKVLSTTLLDKSYDRCLSLTSKQMAGEKESVILIDGWKNSSTNRKTVVSMLHVANGTRAFLNAWDLSGTSEDADELSNIIYESMDLCEKMYKVKAFAVVSDNASTMIKMGTNVSHVLWHTTCHSHIGNLLAKDLADHNLIQKVNDVLKEFKHCDFENIIVSKGGKRIRLACETRWNSYRDAFVNLLDNIQFMKEIHVDPTCFKKVKPKIVKLIFDDDFVNEISEAVELFNPVCLIIDKCQSSDASIADAGDLWLSIHLPTKFQKHEIQLKYRQKKALNQYVLTAFYLHPHYDKSKLNKSQLDEINQFLFHHLKKDGIAGWDLYKKRCGIFATLDEKRITDPLLFWSMAEMDHSNLAKLAIRLLKIPASSAQIERLFSNWSFIQPPIKNRLTFERSKKLVHIYYSLKNLENTNEFGIGGSKKSD